ncbi:MAG: VOC family protein [bacterium]|nr:VOC family protein [bacterium]
MIRDMPEYPTVVPYLSVRDASRALAFYRDAFGAEETRRLVDPAGGVIHAEVRLGGAPVMLAEENAAWGNHSPASLGGTAVRLVLNVPDVDAVVARAVAAGATVVIPVADQFYGERAGRVADPFGHQWIVSTRIEDVSTDEMQRRATALYGDG